MSGIEIFLVLGGLAYEAIYIPCSLIMFRSGSADSSIIPFHALAVLLGLTSAVLTVRDLRLRRFESEEARLRWAMLISATFGIGWLVYIFKHALRPRRDGNEG
jgi:hypothetical protein